MLECLLYLVFLHPFLLLLLLLLLLLVLFLILLFIILFLRAGRLFNNRGLATTARRMSAP
jgi:hypothetical protein